MKLTKTNRRQFNKFFNDLFKLLDFRPNNLFLNGSYGQAIKALYAGDIDFYEKINKNNFNEWFNTTYQDLKEEIKDSLLELKIGNTKYKKFIDDKDKILNDLLIGDKKWIKIDFYIFVDILPTEVSMIYDFGEIIEEDIINGLVIDIEEKFDDGEYFKVIKKLYSLYRYENIKDEKMDLINDILTNPLYGNIYLLKSKIDTILRIDSKDKKKKYNEYIKEWLRKLGLTSLYTSNYKTLYNKLNDHLNKLMYDNYIQKLIK